MLYNRNKSFDSIYENRYWVKDTLIGLKKVGAGSGGEGGGLYIVRIVCYISDI